MNLGRRAVNETEIIKRRYIPLLSVNPRSNKAAGGRDVGGGDGGVVVMEDGCIFCVFSSSTIAIVCVRACKREKERVRAFSTIF